MKNIGILFPHQLFTHHDIHEKCDHLVLIEEFIFFKEFNFHKQKLALHRASMKAHFLELQSRKLNVEYISSLEKRSDIRVFLSEIKKKYTQTLHYINPTDYWLEKRIKEAVEQHKISIKEYENPIFINDREDLKSFFNEQKKKFFQTSFYKLQRVKHNLLMDVNGQPTGGKWTYDSENRKKYPTKKTPPALPQIQISEIWKSAKEYVQIHFPNNPGELPENSSYPFDRKTVNKWIEKFLQSRFHEFGPYEDAIVSDQVWLNHSILSPLLNIGLIQPKQLISKALSFGQKNEVPLNSIEGFLRQIVGWREFIRGMYEVKGVCSRSKNSFQFKKKIPTSFYEGTTGIKPLDDSIKKVLKHAYCHHIERLMVIGNFMLLCEFDPDEVYRWFMELFIDSYDWVMVPNVYGMSQFADGGFFASKPYISSSNYIIKMSDYKKEEWTRIWDGLFWRFMDKHRNIMRKNPRLSMLISTFEKMNPEKKSQHLILANNYLKNLSMLEN
tara:strand:+ start:1150 stop:2643 length:1494 start_codon:yes stop_codon:yes gene_type:complete